MRSAAATTTTQDHTAIDEASGRATSGCLKSGSRGSRPPADSIPALGSCFIDAGDPSLPYNDAIGDPNDIGATGGPGGADFLALIDTDGDGYTGVQDCNDADPLVYLGAPDACGDAGDAVDSDCSGGDAPDADLDGYEDDGCGGLDCDDSDPSISPDGLDLSCDAIDQDCFGGDELDFDSDGYDCDAGDCDDFTAATNPGAPELCNATDDDCDGVLPIDEQDLDADGYLACDDDCDDASAEAFPGAPELCDGLDDDCDGAVPADEVDADADGSLACADCDDTDPSNFPDNPEVCDGADNDCDGAPEPAAADADGDGVLLCDGDCDDGDATVYPAAPEVCDGLDNDCEGDIDEGFDADGDSFTSCGGDCDDASAEAFPGAPELCDGLDNDCDGAPAADEADADDDGVRLCEEDCDDEDPDVAPGFDELCDDLDNDCDEALSPDEQDLDGDGFVPCDEPEPGAGLVGGDCDDARATVSPDAAFDFCDGNDSDCDGVLDPTEVDDDGDGYIDCGTFFDEEPADGVIGSDDCDPAEATVHPTAPELCDGLDNDCDGNLIQGEADTDGDGFLTCNPGEPDPATFDCDDASAEVFPGAPELCDGVDQDCDGDLIEDFGDADGDDLPDCDAAAVPAPGCDGGCSATGPTGPRHRGAVPDPVPAVALLLLPLARRRRRGRSR